MMTNQTKRSLIAQLHIAKKQLGMDDYSYRQLLKDATGKTSSKELTVPELHQAIHAMKQRGFKPKPGTRKPKAPTRIDKMRAIWINMGYGGFIDDASDAALLHWIQGELKKRNADPIDALKWLDSHKECNRILEQLKRWRDRVVKAGLNADLKTISEAQARFDEHGMGQREVIQTLLDHGVITWHQLFNEIGLERQGHYTGNRKQLRDLNAVLGEEKCS